MDWSGSYNNAQSGGIPSLKIYDEGQDLGLGLSKISIFQWQPSFDVEFEIDTLTDLTEPIGYSQSNDIWVYGDDEIEDYDKN